MENLIDDKTEQTVVRYIPRNATLYSLAEFFSACSDVTRAKIICALSISEMCVSDLSRILELNQTTCSHQLRLLRAADIVKQRRDGKIIYYSLKNPKITHGIFFIKEKYSISSLKFNSETCAPKQPSFFLLPKI